MSVVVVRLSAGPQPERSVAAGTTAGQLLADPELTEAGAANLVVAARVNGVARDLAHVLEDGDRWSRSRSTPTRAARSCGTPPRT